MKGTLLVLALLVTQELGIEMVESCPIFYSTFGALVFGKKLPLNLELDLVGATEPEKAALGKIQDCYNEKGIGAKLVDLTVMATITTSKQCISETVAQVKEAVAPLEDAVAPLKDAVVSLGR